MTDVPADLEADLEGGLAEPEDLEPAQGSLRLSSPGDDYDAAQWEAATAGVLRKARRLGDDDPDSAVWAKLARTTLDGIEVAPIGVPGDLEGVATSGRPTRAGDWDIRTHVSGPDAAQANEAVLLDLDNGATSLWVELGAGLGVEDLPRALKGVLLDLAPVVLSGSSAAAASALVALADDTGVDLHPGTNFGVDPLADDIAEVAHLARAHGVLGVVASGLAVHEQGASDAQELAVAIAGGVTALRVLTGAGFTPDEAAAVIEFRLAVTDEQFPSIAKLRAARRLWTRVLELSGVGDLTVRQHAVTSRAQMSKYDPWVNILRGTVAAFAAGVGGAEAVTVIPFDEPLGLPDALGRRIARNTSSLLISESHVARVADPAGGSYAVEKLTDDLAAAGWAAFQQIEAAGGLAADVGLAGRIAEVAAVRDDQVAHRTRPLTGVSEFPHLGESLPVRQPSPVGADVRRYGAAFEALRDEPAAAPVFLATMGSVAAHTARATFATNLFAAGGVAVEAAGPADGVESVLAAYTSQGVACSVVCLAGTDKAYADWGTDLVTALREAGATHVIIAGKPIDGVDDSCAVGVDALAFLTRTREKLA
ncbi:methylmalonyl-CoA mutase family protein [Nocardioides sp.]|uniref:methylmalonyl-CoA mutase family protein n=1 Tax=Nocardioides sp. TaxID=35761 RepID=UPI002C8EEA08|nr:methylmalonyl-CoA mutase family protein [Nocardioides sp.]HXH77083.1 methylmalonyl-CoA mutase family protein [Nocardioides sp.]